MEKRNFAAMRAYAGTRLRRPPEHLRLPAHFVGLGQFGVALYLAHVPYAAAEDGALHRRVLQTVEKSHEVGHDAVHNRVVVFGGRGYEVKLLVLHLRVGAAAAVYQRLHLGAHGVEIHRRGHHDDVGRQHFFDNRGRVVVLRAGLLVDAACAAAQTGMDVLVAQENLFGTVARLQGAAQKFVAKRVGIAAAAGARR